MVLSWPWDSQIAVKQNVLLKGPNYGCFSDRFPNFLEKFLGEKYRKEIYAEEYILNFEQTHSENKAS